MTHDRLITVTVTIPSTAPDEIRARIETMARELGLAGGIDQVQFVELRACIVCGCTDDDSCIGGCWWTSDADVCSRCCPKPMPLADTLEYIDTVLNVEMLPWQVTFLTEQLGPTRCPECRDGKPRNCTGWTLNSVDEEIPCATQREQRVQRERGES